MDFDIFGRNVTDKVGNQKTLYYATTNNLFLHYLAKRGNTKITYFTQIGLFHTHNAPVRYLFERKQKLIRR